MGIAGPECVAKLEAAVLDLAGVESCSIVRLADGHGGTDGSAAPTAVIPRSSAAAVTDGYSSGGGGGGGGATHLLTATRTPPPRFEPLRPSGSGNDTSSGNSNSYGNRNRNDTGYVGNDSGNGTRNGNGNDSGNLNISGGGGGGARVGRPDDDVWDALRAAHDATGRRKVAGVRDVLEAVRSL
ncbi:unnamed protein product, partial [Laminaria digitata]